MTELQFAPDPLEGARWTKLGSHHGAAAEVVVGDRIVPPPTGMEPGCAARSPPIGDAGLPRWIGVGRARRLPPMRSVSGARTR